MSRLFESSSINKLQLPNRFVRSATWEGLAEPDGSVTQQLIDTMAALARGKVGLIVTGHAHVRPEGQASLRQLGLYKDELLPGLRQLTAAVHDQGGRIAAQLAHAGTFAAEKLSGQMPWAVSQFEGLADSPRHEMTINDIKELVTAFAAAAVRAKDAGFDAVQLHSAHGYLLSQFLSPIFNRRRDEYGGSIANRARIHVEILKAVRQAVGVDYPVLIKMNCQDFAEGGLSVADAVQAAELLAPAGLDAVEVSGGLLTGGKLSPIRPGINSPEKEAYFSAELQSFRKAINLPLILVGGIRSFEVAEHLVNDGLADYIAMSRPFIREPDLIRRWQDGDRRKATCRSDNLCFKPALAGQGIYCVTAEKEAKKAS
jgi:2,4-dienoyl-CoA reductase-like NADH-dependent reductase (Old Yellow Enzyme family)